jgi:hypothetical protein
LKAAWLSMLGDSFKANLVRAALFSLY